MGDWVSTLPWKHFITLTTGYELTLPSARRLNQRLVDRISSEVIPGNPVQLFWVAEKFECKDGYHTHGLLNYPEDAFPSHCFPAEVLDESFQIVSGARKNGYKKFHCNFSKYDPKKAAARYCSKYLLKRCADWDFIVGS